MSFGETALDPGTQDAAGIIFRFSAVDSGVTGEVEEITGESELQVPITDLQIDLRSGAIDFAYGEGDDRSTFRGAISCDSMVGRWEIAPGDAKQKMFRRRG